MECVIDIAHGSKVNTRKCLSFDRVGLIRLKAAEMRAAHRSGKGSGDFHPHRFSGSSNQTALPSLLSSSSYPSTLPSSSASFAQCHSLTRLHFADSTSFPFLSKFRSCHLSPTFHHGSLHYRSAVQQQQQQDQETNLPSLEHSQG